MLNPAWTWAVWYPLRRSGRFAQLPAEEQRVILAEHGTIGMSYGAGDFAHDIRLACHGLDKEDNDFVVGLIGKELYPLSRIVQDMRRPNRRRSTSSGSGRSSSGGRSIRARCRAFDVSSSFSLYPFNAEP